MNEISLQKAIQYRVFQEVGTRFQNQRLRSLDQLFRSLVSIGWMKNNHVEKDGDLKRRVEYLESVRDENRAVNCQALKEWRKRAERRLRDLYSGIEGQRERDMEGQEVVLRSLEEKYEVAMEDVVQRMKVLEEERVTSAAEGLEDMARRGETGEILYLLFLS